MSELRSWHLRIMHLCLLDDKKIFVSKIENLVDTFCFDESPAKLSDDTIGLKNVCLLNVSKYSRMDQVKFVEDSL